MRGPAQLELSGPPSRCQNGVRCGAREQALGTIYEEALRICEMKTNTPSTDALMSSIRNQFPRESEEQHRKRFIEMVRNGDWKIREEVVKSLFAVYVNRAYR